MSLQKIRDEVMLNARPRRMSVSRFFVQIVLALYFLVFVSDTLNLDVLYASLFGNITFVDDGAISDSLFDVGPTQHASAFTQAVRSNDHLGFVSHSQKLSDDGMTLRNAVYEDEDSPGVQDAQTSTSVASAIVVGQPERDRAVRTLTIPIDRIISFQQILI